MLPALLRKTRSLSADPVLRRWLGARLLLRTPGEPAFTAHRPPVLGASWAGLPLESPRAAFPPLPPGPPDRPIRLRLPGTTVTLEPGAATSLFERKFADPEAERGLHRFGWVPLMDPGDDPRWVGAIWAAWRARFGDAPSLAAWRADVAADRAATLLTFAQTHGLPGPAADTLAVLAAHGPAIAARLDYFGPRRTTSRLFKNGRGLYRLGLALGLPAATDAGARLMLSEAERIFRPSGMLDEGSSHDHLLMTRALADVWLAATAHGRPEAVPFEARLRAAAGHLVHLCLPGGLPLIGRIAADAPPAHLACLLPGGDRDSGWMATLPRPDRDRLATLLDGLPLGPGAIDDGWLSARFGAWSGLWHADPEGWGSLSGHGHQDCGGFELHHQSEAILIDLGNGPDSAADATASAHNGLTIDGADPYPLNRPCYAPAFRDKIAGPAVLALDDSGVALAHHGFRRLRNVGMTERRWLFSGDRVVIRDRIDGRDRHTVVRRLYTPCAVERAERGVILTTASGRRFHLAAGDAPLLPSPCRRWLAHGESVPATGLVLSLFPQLPWTGTLTIEAL
ncbi:heparinase II/III domain-containing protein [Magnetospirillum fulvum]|uniref:Heparinase II/III-like protein n=1 Tax=Magnetospirillum fulvum TaxID=1082 RepID=A0A1H6GYH6_MAGFU|nr:heparinase II/III family protein [Magnetospirillum fulvum]SEH28559.1 Heparinase II/III-like protein [Magnetospirillum fulvum]